MSQKLTTAERIQILERWQQSGLSMQKFARQDDSGVKVHQLAYWKDRLPIWKGSQGESNTNGHPTSQGYATGAAKARRVPRRKKLEVKASLRAGLVRCPCCGVDIVEEYTKLVMKLTAVAAFNL